MSSINDYSNPSIVFKKAKQYLGPNTIIKLSDKPAKKYMVLNPNNNKWIYFGQMGYQDYTYTNNDQKRAAYLKRSANIKGDWKDKYSPNNLSRNILW